MEDNQSTLSSFIVKLTLMLKDATAYPYISWSHSGESIVVTDPTAFAIKVLPRYFKHGNFASFVRQLNLYGFHKTSQEATACEFTNPLFRRGDEHLLKAIRRKVPKDPQDKELFNVACESERLMKDFADLRSKYEKLESALQQKEAEKQMIVNELMQSKQRQEVFEARLDKMVQVLMKACSSVGISPLPCSGSKRQIMDLDGKSSVKRPCLLEGIDGEMAGGRIDHVKMDEWLDSLLTDTLGDAKNALKSQEWTAGREPLKLTNGKQSSRKDSMEEAAKQQDSIVLALDEPLEEVLFEQHAPLEIGDGPAADLSENMVASIAQPAAMPLEEAPAQVLAIFLLLPCLPSHITASRLSCPFVFTSSSISSLTIATARERAAR
uniref:HSF-type DNA-binding domain-containing protein n=1 Tax=Guillardia theta TaxID=55529 RepID=A0A7S4L8L6_GUITH|mmetsp:Transcript_39251/g.123792  ORF Transcript_39251/g.123792 Transcript_39251/m.123792 type:complete len:380 (+) Transcript_39251:555-1694(+)